MNPAPSNSSSPSAADPVGVIAVQAAGGGAQINPGLPHLTLIPPSSRKPPAQPLAQTGLLNPYRRSIPLVGREPDMQSLWAWLHSDGPASVRILTGRAGAGKTRAAIELIERLNTQNPGQWWAGFVQGIELRRFTALPSLAAWGWARPTLVVVDYAASLLEPVRQWLRALSQRAAPAGGPPLRLLLLERHASAAEGWLQSLYLGGDGLAGIPRLFDPLEPKRLAPLDTPAKRREVLASMLQAGLSVPLGRALPGPGRNPRFDRLLQNPVWEDPLSLMMAALLSGQSDWTDLLELPRTELVLRVANLEFKRLAEGAPLPEAGRLVAHLVAFATLAGGLSQQQALVVAGEELDALNLRYPGGPGALASRAQDVRPAAGHGIAPVAPGILAEAFVMEALGQLPLREQLAAVHRACRTLGPRVMPFIVRTVQDFVPAGRTAALTWLESLIQAGWADDLGLLAEIDHAMPRHTLALRDKAAAMAELIAQRSAALAQNNPAEPVLAEQSRLLNSLASRLSDLGRREEALTQAQEAARICEQLSRSRPDAFRPCLASSLSNLARMLGSLGRREEALAKAQEAVQAYEQLARSKPGTFLPDLAGSLSNLAGRLADMDRREEALAKAQEAVEIHNQLAQAQPETHQPDLAGSLNNLAAVLSDLGRREEALAKAQEAVRLRQQLAQARPDAFLPDLAQSLAVQGGILAGLDRHPDAIPVFAEAIRQLAPALRTVPQLYAGLMNAIVERYLRSVEQARQQPDHELIAPVLQLFERFHTPAPKR